jgi:hypothetical protein
LLERAIIKSLDHAMSSNEQRMNYIAWCNGIGFRGDVIDFVTVESFRWRLAERDDWDSAKSRDKNDRNAIVSRRGWRVK